MTTLSAAKGPRGAPSHEDRVPLTLTEWQTESFEGVTLSSEDRQHLRGMGALAENGKVQVEELRTGLKVRTRSWVGVVRLERLEIRVISKLAGENLGLVRMLEYASGLEGLSWPEATATLDFKGTHLLDLVALLFAGAVEGVARRGLLADYQEREDDLPTVRGRILTRRQLLERMGRNDRIICRFDELEQDVDENRLLLAAIRVALRRVGAPQLRTRLGRLRAVFEPICDPVQLDLRAARALRYNRLNSHYERAHQLGWLLLDGLGVDELLAPGATSTFAFLLDMNLLFERFAKRLVEDLLPRHYRVEYQLSDSSILCDVTTSRPYARVIPDLVVAPRGSSGPRLPIDAKYKLYDERALPASDLYQSFLYAYSIGSGRALLLYPQSAAETRPTHIEVRGHARQTTPAEIRALAVSIPAVLEEIQASTIGEHSAAVLEAITRWVPPGGGVSAWGRPDQLSSLVSSGFPADSAGSA